jgi:hypothetical protein
MIPLKITLSCLVALTIAGIVVFGETGSSSEVSPNPQSHSSERMKSYRLSLKRILATHRDAPYDPEHREFIEAIASALYERHEQFSSWPESVQFFYACYDINYQVGNGGFAQAAYNVPELLPVAKRAFDQFGRKKAAELCRRAITMLPVELQTHLAKGLKDRPSLDEVFKHFDESKMAVLDKDLPEEFWADDALQQLVERNRADFESIDQI